ncbi:MAG: glycosyltransferase family 2 protein [Rhodocyclaceae bacterium]|jgi:glycosyltransferase involved in cell wall biosynthesis|nr:glycosyltransferase family 2 protein [Rhodocyclaceae bacterium]
MTEKSASPVTARLPLSLVLITLNAGSRLRDVLASVPFADEIVVVDSGSTDETASIANEFGARFEQHAWVGFGPQKAHAVSLARNEWVLCLDADEALSPELARSIHNAFRDGLPDYPVYRFARCNVFMGHPLKHGEGYPDFNTRLFRRDAAHWSDDIVHEHVLSDLAPRTLEGDLLHYSADDLKIYLDKQNRYTSLAAERALARGEQAPLARIVLSPLTRFLKFWLVRGGWRDGLPGFVHIVIGCQNSFMKYVKLRDLRRQAGQE